MIYPEGDVFLLESALELARDVLQDTREARVLAIRQGDGQEIRRLRVINLLWQRWHDRVKNMLIAVEMGTDGQDIHTLLKDCPDNKVLR